MEWRNEQVYHLRQNTTLTPLEQDRYFDEIVSSLFSESNPSQVLFSYLEGEKCIGYGGLVHINWVDRNAEISFIMNTVLENEFFEFHWINFLKMIQNIAFNELCFNKIFTYAFDLRPRLYPALEESGFYNEAVLKDHCRFQDNYRDVLIHSKINHLSLRPITLEDVKITFEWASDKEVRKYSFSTNEISFNEHTKWFDSKYKDHNCFYYIFENSLGTPLGSIRVDLQESVGVISYLIGPKYHGKGLGKEIIKQLERRIIKDYGDIRELVGYVVDENLASVRIFEKLEYKKNVESGKLKFIKVIR
jgi:RimJ/RimL family protein N-acetyltransferase